MNSIGAYYHPVFLFANRYRFSESWWFPESSIPYCMFRYIISGDAIFTIDGRECVVHAGDIAYIPQGCHMSCIALSPVEFISVRFTGSIQISGTDLLSKFFHVQRVSPGSAESLDWFERIHQSTMSDDAHKMLEISGYLSLITAHLARYGAECCPDSCETDELLMNMQLPVQPQSDTDLSMDARISNLVDYIITHPNENIDCAQLCQMGSMSESSLRRLFKSHTGKTPTEFLRELRMNTAAQRLLTSNESISDIAYSMGFETPNYFSRLFRETFGISPKQYRKQSESL